MSNPEGGIGEPAKLFAALGDPTRLALVARLSAGESLSIAALSSDTRLTRQAVTKHLHVMQEAGLVASERVGRESRYAFRPEALDGARAYLDAVSGQWRDALHRLKRFVEE
ncbi:ArsR/SmtB family transcription factor [Jiella sonneratiae]|uniref:Helix-turn-helix transcriptional regulator n=1 Tax=Jiella sonneratiae TaxID=2816856 RepID=A0ABS3J7H4_9HYPH|nr:metalloregulator ArsR/SmtB family transcription factor [Jiella sonneratiae]MBO0904541.1 helix-turn-helix transcriptional regulator [Jiella sonneratiae]